MAAQSGSSAFGAMGEVTRGVVFMLLFVLIAPGIDVFAKFAAQILPPGEVAFARFAVQFVVLAPIVLWRARLPGAARLAMTGRRIGLHSLRGVLIGAATIAFIAAIREMPIADAMAIFFVEPLILTLLGGLLLGEKVGWRRYLACAVGFVGVLIVVRPSFKEVGVVALFPVFCAFSFAFYILLTRHLAQREEPLSLQLSAGFFATLFVGGVLLLFEGSGNYALDPVWPDMKGLWLMLGVGVMATISHLFLTHAFRAAPASVLAPLQYLEIVTATIVSYAFFGDFPDAVKWLGIVIITGSGLFVFWRERQLEREGRLA
jgi:S-adenosylmethionine uptake transporter